MITIHKIEHILLAAIAQRADRTSDSALQESISRDNLKKLPVLTVTEQGLVCVSGNRRLDALDELGWVTVTAYVVLGNVNELPEELL